MVNYFLHWRWSTISSIAEVNYFHCSWSTTSSIGDGQLLLPLQLVNYFFQCSWSTTSSIAAAQVLLPLQLCTKFFVFLQKKKQIDDCFTNFFFFFRTVRQHAQWVIIVVLYFRWTTTWQTIFTYRRRSHWMSWRSTWSPWRRSTTISGRTGASHGEQRKRWVKLLPCHTKVLCLIFIISDEVFF